MAPKKKKVDPIKQREKRTKIAAIVGVVLLTVVAAYEIPSMLKVMNKKPPVSSASSALPVSTTGALPNVAGTTATAAAPGDLIDTDVPPSSAAGQLVSFTVFETKNPFTPQVSDTPDDQTAAAGPTAADTPSADARRSDAPTTPVTAQPGGGVVPPTTAPSGGAVTTTTTTEAPRRTVAISVNGVISRVLGQGTFPAGAPVFRLASWTKEVAHVSIVGGSYATGEPTLTLHIGQSVTLENQTDGKRYRLELLSTP
jgi:hypothetical protein